ncbi:YigZ family protein [Oerskovia flava]|uniref:YigZ family protein n=1 Tax=Oerskovia flava TaxID=2986422 RepID=UPI00224073BB|nr:YigZ family protein [Oerskovia sp. JB1-3-2]
MEPVPLPTTIAAPVTTELVVKKSRFITHLSPVGTVAGAEAVVARVRKEHWDARHHCVALVVGTHADQQRSSDDGEPSGTAGVPMLEVLRQRGMTDVVAVVTRYFGGVLLGAGGLVRAYSGAVSAAVDAARTVHRAVVTEVRLTAEHTDAGRVAHLLHEWCATHGALLEDTRYTDVVAFDLVVPPAALDALDAVLAELSGGHLVAERGHERIVDLP